MLVTSAAIVALGAIAAAAIGSHVVLDEFRDLERTAATRDLERASAAIASDLDNIAAVATDWGVWDDTRAFVADPQGEQEYLDSNLPTATFVGLSLNLIVLTDDTSDVLYAGAVDLATEEAEDPTPVVAAMQKRGLLATFSDPDGARTGLVRIDDRLLALSVRAVTDSEGAAAPNGTLTMARWVTDEVVTAIAERTRLDIVIDLEGVPVTDLTHTTTDGTEGSITTAAPLVDIAGNPVAQLSVTEPRTILAQGAGAVRMMTLVVVAVLAAAGVLLLVVADRQVLRRLRRLGREIEFVGTSPEGTLRVTVDHRHDEIAEVASHLNQTLGALERTQQDLQLRNLELAETNRELEEANHTRRRFLYAVSHDLRSPLTSIRGFVVLLQRRWGRLDDSQRRDFLERIEMRSTAMDGMIDDLLTLSQLQEATVKAEPMDIALPTFLTELVADSHVPGVLLTEVCGTARVDPGHLARIVTNLIDNAGKYGAPPVEVSATCDGDTVELRIRDHGDGVPAEFESALFEAFSQARPAGEVEGVGLGLSIVHHLVSQNDGRVHHERPDGLGACFVVTLPRSPEDGGPAPRARAGNGAGQHRG